ncbi:MAG: hypothetical protein M1817_005489 [Caeruleum heppii]|nr:MAG: hypothetical protein M1817_005489 [Caeruleum heppii]
MSLQPLKAGILIVSDTASHDPSTDLTTEKLRHTFDVVGEGQWDVIETEIVPDNVTHIQRVVTAWTDSEHALNLIITSGGTGFAAKDFTPEVGANHYLNLGSASSEAMEHTLILTLPGSPKGAQENLQAVLKLLPHACIQAAGANSRAMHAGGVSKLEKDAGLAPGPANGPRQEQQPRTHHGAVHNNKVGGHGQDHGRSCGKHAFPTAHTTQDDQLLSNDPHRSPAERQRSSPYPMTSMREATELVRLKTPSPRAITVAVDGDLVGCVLAEDVTATESVPAFRASIVDGYAVVVGSHGTTSKGIFPVATVSHATPGEVMPLRSGQIARITTGAPLPPDATAVVMVEDTRLHNITDEDGEEKEVEILTDRVRSGENVREVGSDIRAGDVILHRGERVSATGGELGLLVSVGRREVVIYKRPVVGVLSTGDEIVSHDRSSPLRYGEVRDCNRPTILAAVRGWGFQAVDLGVASDKPGDLEQMLRDALRRVDVIVSTGGVSMGELDLLKPTIERSLGGEIHFGRVAMKPGKPTTFASLPYKDASGTTATKLMFSLPGNPASAIVTLHLFVLPSLHHASGVNPAGLPTALVTLKHEVRPDPQRPEYHRAIVSVGKNGRLHASSTGGQRSSRIGSLRSANALLCLAAGATPLAPGTTVEALLMDMLVAE